MSVHRYCCIVVGKWMLRDWHLYRYTLHRSAKKPQSVQWHMWDRVL